MKKYLFILALFVLVFIPVKTLDAGGGSYTYKVYANKKSAPADGSSTITITVNTYYYECDADYDGEGGHVTVWDPSECSEYTPSTATKYNVSTSDYPLLGKLYASATGSGNTLSKSSFHTSNGYATFTIKSTVAGSKTIKVTDSEGGYNPTWDYKETVTFTTPTASSGSGTNATNTTQTEEKKIEKPKAPVLNKLVVAGNELTGEGLKEENHFRYSEGVTFSGTTVANGIIHLYFNSDPYETEVTADKKGAWEYTLDRDLGEGEHTLEIAVEDPKTKKISDKSKPYSFTLLAAETDTIDDSVGAVEESAAYPLSFWVIIGGIVIIVAGSGIGGWLYYKKRKKNSASN